MADVPHPGLLDPGQAAEAAPEAFRVKFVTTKGDVVVKVTRAWSPHGADRLYNLARIGFFTDVAFFRVIPRFMAQFGIHGDPKASRAWHAAHIPDDPVAESNVRGTLTFATAGPDTRSTQFFFNFGNNASLDGQGFSPLGKVAEGMDVVDSIFSGYGEGAPAGAGPDQSRVHREGNVYLRENFPQLDYIRSAQVVE